MDFENPKLGKSRPMERRTVSFVFLETVLRIFGFERFHPGIPGDFCEYGCGSDDFKQLIAPNMFLDFNLFIFFELGKLKSIVVVSIDMNFLEIDGFSFGRFEHFQYFHD